MTISSTVKPDQPSRAGPAPGTVSPRIQRHRNFAVRSTSNAPGPGRPGYARGTARMTTGRAAYRVPRRRSPRAAGAGRARPATQLTVINEYRSSYDAGRRYSSDWRGISLTFALALPYAPCIPARRRHHGRGRDRGPADRT